MEDVTITIPRDDEDITVVVSPAGEITTAIDEDGNDVVLTLTEIEKHWALALAESGHDETGR
jgi:hypothetical protein